MVPVPVPMPSPEALRYYHSGNLLWAVATAWSLLVPALMFFSGFSARLRDWARRIGRYWYATLVIYLAGFTLTIFLANVGLSYYGNFVRPHAYALSSQTLGKWLHDELLGTAVDFVGGALCLWLPYLLLRCAARRWWLYTWFASIPVLLCFVWVEPIWIEPLFNHFGSMQDKVLETRILNLAHRAGIDGAKVYEVDKSVDTHRLNAYVTGIGATQRIVLWDTSIRQFTAEELLLVMGHEMGHFVLGHVWLWLVFGSVLSLASLWLLHVIAHWLLRRFGARTGVTELSDIASLPLLMWLVGALLFLMQPVVLAYSRHLEHEADRFGLEITHDNHACATAFAKFVVHDLSYPRPSAFIELWRYSHPPLAQRIAFCNTYHPWLEGQHGRYDRYFTTP